MTDDPDRDRRPTHPSPVSTKTRLACGVTWTAPAKREYGGLGLETTRASAAKIVRQASRATLDYLRTHTGSFGSIPAGVACALDATFVSDEEMREYNAQYRGKNKPTDVLSFAQNEGEFFLQGGEETMLGDLVLAVGVAARQGEQLKHGFEWEITFLTIHGVLHLCGYDHDTAARRRVMWKTQDAIFAQLGAPASTSCSSR